MSAPTATYPCRNPSVPRWLLRLVVLGIVVTVGGPALAQDTGPAERSPTPATETSAAPTERSPEPTEKSPGPAEPKGPTEPKAPAVDVPAVDLPRALEDAYKKEFAFLEAEKRALRRRVADVKAEERRREAQALVEIEGLRAQLLTARDQIAGLEDQVREAQDDGAKGEDDVSRLDEALARARETLTTAGVTLPDDPRQAAREAAEAAREAAEAAREAVEQADAGGAEAPIEPAAAETGTPEPGPSVSPEVLAAYVRTVFDAAAALVTQQGALRRERGTFFTGDGKQIEGELVHLGRVASWGVSDAGAGVLAPAGGGHLKLWPVATGPSAQALADGRVASLESLPLFLYDSLDKAMEPKVDKTPLQIVEAGGVIAWVIVWLGVAALVLAALRLLLVVLLGVGSARLVARVALLVREGRAAEAVALTQRSFRCVPRVLHATARGIAAGVCREDQETVVAESILREGPRLERFGSAMTVIAAVAPLLGLLGTVTGMIATFDLITEFGTGDPKMLSGGISEALITTELGLVVAIPTLILGAFLNSLANSASVRLERVALHVVNAETLRDLDDRADSASDPEPSGGLGEPVPTLGPGPAPDLSAGVPA